MKSAITLLSVASLLAISGVAKADNPHAIVQAGFGPSVGADINGSPIKGDFHFDIGLGHEIVRDNDLSFGVELVGSVETNPHPLELLYRGGLGVILRNSWASTNLFCGASFLNDFINGYNYMTIGWHVGVVQSFRLSYFQLSVPMYYDYLDGRQNMTVALTTGFQY